MARRLTLGAASVLLLFAFGALCFLGYRSFVTPGGADGPIVSVGGPFALIDGDGKPVTDQDFRGKWMVVYFGYTHCPDACPTALNAIAVALDKLPAAERGKVQPIFITVDPERDTPPVMKEYVAAFASDIIGLTGTVDALKPVEKSYHVVAEKHPTAGGGYDMDHSSIIYVMDPDGRYSTILAGDASPDDIAASLGKVVG